MGTSVIRAETARASTSEKGTRGKPRRKGDLFNEFLQMLLVFSSVYFVSSFFSKYLPGEAPISLARCY
jgi:hypothetical protein